MIKTKEWSVSRNSETVTSTSLSDNDQKDNDHCQTMIKKKYKTSESDKYANI